MTHHLSFSKGELADHCTYWARCDVEIPERPSLKSGVKGTNIHAACAATVNGTPYSGDPLTSEEARNWASLRRWLETEPPFSGMELPLIYDTATDTAKVCEVDGHRGYLGVTDTSIPGTLDLYRLEPGRLTLLEVKTGSHSRHAKEAEDQQLASQALAAARHFGAERVRVGKIFTRLTKTRPPNWHEHDADALDMHAGNLRRKLKMLPTSQPNRGDHCWDFCPIGPSRKDRLATCPAWVSDEAPAPFEAAQ